MERRDWKWAYCFIAPAIIGLVVLNIYPFIKSVGMTFVDKNTEVVGLSNYVRMFTGDDYFWGVNVNTLFFTAITVPIGVLIALVLASMLNTKIRGTSIYRSIFFLPLVCSSASVALVWKWGVFNKSSGVLNYLLSLVGVTGPDWIGDPKVVMFSVITVAIWGAIGYDIILILAGLKNIPETYYEAAIIDGAGAWALFRHITVPLISPTLFFVFIMRAMNSIRQFDLSFMFSLSTDLTFRSVQTLMYEFYRESFTRFNPNYGATIAIWTVGMILIITGIQFLFEKRWVHYDN